MWEGLVIWLHVKLVFFCNVLMGMDGKEMIIDGHVAHLVSFWKKDYFCQLILLFNLFLLLFNGLASLFGTIHGVSLYYFG